MNDFIVVGHLEIYIFIVADSKWIEKDTSEEYLEPSSIRRNSVSDEEIYRTTEPEEQCNGNNSKQDSHMQFKVSLKSVF